MRAREVVIGLLALLVAVAAGARDGDFWFETPRGQLGVRVGMTLAGTDSEIYDFVTEQLTLEEGDFNAPTLCIDLALGLRERLDVVFGFEYSRTTTASEFRDYVGDDGLPIAQQTRLAVMPLTIGLRYYVTPRGRRAGNLAWVPNTVAAYLGAGAGPQWYRFEQWGEFVDYADLSIFRSRLVSDGWTFTAQLGGGVDINLSQRLVLALEAHYGWASADMSADFVDFDAIDLSGLRATAGVGVRF
jgi:hypothetical protein